MAVKLSARERAKIRVGDFGWNEELLRKVTAEIEAQDALEAQKAAGGYNPTQRPKKPRKTPKNAQKTAIDLERLEAEGQTRLFDAKGRHGGARKGAGRPKGEGDPKTVWAVRVTAAEKALLLDYLLEIRDRATIKEQ